MNKEKKEKKIILTEEQASRVAETLLNSWLKGENSNNLSSKDNKSNKNSK